MGNGKSTKKINLKTLKIKKKRKKCFLSLATCDRMLKKVLREWFTWRKNY